MIIMDSPTALGKFRQINTWRSLSLARLKGLRTGLLQISRETRGAVEPLINEAFVKLQYAIDREWERRKTVVRREAAKLSHVFAILPSDGPPVEHKSLGAIRRSIGGGTT